MLAMRVSLDRRCPEGYHISNAQVCGQLSGDRSSGDSTHEEVWPLPGCTVMVVVQVEDFFFLDRGGVACFFKLSIS